MPALDYRTLTECEELVQFLKHDKNYGRLTVMLGVPTGWRTLARDSVADDKLYDIILAANVISPWTVGRYASPISVVRHAGQRWKPERYFSKGQVTRPRYVRPWPVLAAKIPFHPAD